MNQKLAAIASLLVLLSVPWTAGSPASAQGPMPSATLTVDTTVELRPFPAGIRGVNLGNWAFFWSRPYPNDSGKLRELTRLIEPGVLRYAGGLWSNDVTWDRSSTQCYPGRIAGGSWCDRRPYNPWWAGTDTCSGPPRAVANAYHHGYQADEIDALAAFAGYVGADVMIEVDVTTCDPQLWADMVRYANVEHGYGFRYWELGNELDLEHAVGTPDVPVGAEYVRRFKLYHDAMKAVDPGIRIAGPTTAADEEDGYFRAFTDYIDPLTLDAEVVAGQMLDVLSYHHYPFWNHSGGEVGVADLFAYTYDPEGRSREHVNHCSTDKRTLLDGRGLHSTALAVTEFHAMAADLPTSLAFNHAQALYMADTLPRQAAAGADMVLHWELYDLPYDYDTGQVATSYGLINHNNSTAVLDGGGGLVVDDRMTVMPVYYTYFLLAQLFGDRLVQASSTQGDVLSVWASVAADEPDTVWVLVTNLSSDAYQGEIGVSGLRPTSGESFTLQNPQFVVAADKKSVIDGTFVNGLQIDTTSVSTILASSAAILASGQAVAKSGESFVHVFPAYSATVLKLRASASIFHDGFESGGTNAWSSTVG